MGLLLLFIISGLLLIIGLIRPALVLRWGTVKKRIRVFKIFSPLMLLFFLLAIIFAPGDDTKGKVADSNATVVNSESTSIPQSSTPRDLKQQLAETEEKLIASQKRLEQLLVDHPEVRINGKITDRNRDSLQVWGSAVTTGDNRNVFGGLVAEGNIIVLNPHSENNTGIYYNGIHYFQNKTVGKNALGSEVPVWIYGDMPPEILLESKKQKLLMLQIEKLRNIGSPSQIEKGPCDDLIRKMGVMKPPVYNKGDSASKQIEDIKNFKKNSDEIVKQMNICLEKTGYTYQEYILKYGDPLEKQK